MLIIKTYEAAMLCLTEMLLFHTYLLLTQGLHKTLQNNNKSQNFCLYE